MLLADFACKERGEEVLTRKPAKAVLDDSDAPEERMSGERGEERQVKINRQNSVFKKNGMSVQSSRLSKQCFLKCK